MLSLFMSICGGVSWENVLAPLKSISVIWVLLYLFYIAFTYFAVMLLASRCQLGSNPAVFDDGIACLNTVLSSAARAEVESPVKA